MPTAATLLRRFVHETGVSGERSPQRYLWTDAHAVCTLLGLHRETGEVEWRDWAEALIRQVHDVLGSHHPDDPRSGSLGSPERPLSGGLRIGKPRPERRAGEPEDPRGEWDRDGQYFHYLTKWIHALCRAARFLRRPEYLERGMELAVATEAFFRDGGMAWKMSTDLSRPLVDRMGQHDPLDGWVTFLELRGAARGAGLDAGGLGAVLHRTRGLLTRVNPVTADPLGIGGLLVDAFRLDRLGEGQPLRETLLEAASAGLRQTGPFSGSADRRLAFRELGLALGLRAAERMGALHAHVALADRIEAFWREHHEWDEHVQINRVGLATCLAPDGFLGV